MGKSYQILVDWPSQAAGSEVYIHLVGTFPNDGNVHLVDPEKVAEFERSMRIPFNQLAVQPNCVISVAE